MRTEPETCGVLPTDDEQLIEPVEFRFGLSRRAFVQLVSAGLIIVAGPLPAPAQDARRRGGRGGGEPVPGGRIQIGKDGTLTVLTGKVEVGQGSRAEITQAAAEELRVPPERIQLVMGDTAQVPNDGITAGSRTTPSTIPAVRRAAAAARDVLAVLAARGWDVDPAAVRVANGAITDPSTQRTISFAELARGDNLIQALREPITSEVTLTQPADFQSLGNSFKRPNARDLVTGEHRYSSDIQREGMLYGKTLRPPSYGATLRSVDLEPARKMEGVIALRDGDFVGVCARSSLLAQQALAAVAATATWETTPAPSSEEVYDYLRNRVRNGIPENPFASVLEAAAKRFRQTYPIAYVQHAPMETRAAVAEWDDGRVTVWTGTQNPFGVQSELTRALRLQDSQVRVIVPDTGGGFGGKHTGEVAVEAARLALASGQPVSVKWTREEEFTWAYFRPAAVVDIEASLSDKGRLTSWYFININGGRAGVESPYRCPQARSGDVRSDAPLRQGSYRALGATGSNFARECFMDELAEAAAVDPLDFRLAHLEDSGNAARLRAVLEEAAKRFNWRDRSKQKGSNVGVGLACGTEKGSYVAACVEVEVDRQRHALAVRKVCEVFECGTVYNPDNLRSQIEGCIIMALGPALREEMRFADGRMQNPRFSQYAVPRFSDMPDLDIDVLDRRDLPAVGAGETPIIAVTPAIANAVFHATGKRVRSMPMRLPET